MTDLDRIPLTVTWISVEHSLPPLGERVLVAYRGNDVATFSAPMWGDVRWLPEDVTHWMPLPVAPENVVMEES